MERCGISGLRMDRHPAARQGLPAHAGHDGRLEADHRARRSAVARPAAAPASRPPTHEPRDGAAPAGDVDSGRRPGRAERVVPAWHLSQCVPQPPQDRRHPCGGLLGAGGRLPRLGRKHEPAALGAEHHGRCRGGLGRTDAPRAEAGFSRDFRAFDGQRRRRRTGAAPPRAARLWRAGRRVGHDLDARHGSRLRCRRRRAGAAGDAAIRVDRQDRQHRRAEMVPQRHRRQDRAAAADAAPVRRGARREARRDVRGRLAQRAAPGIRATLPGGLARRGREPAGGLQRARPGEDRQHGRGPP